MSERKSLEPNWLKEFRRDFEGEPWLGVLMVFTILISFSAIAFGLILLIAAAPIMGLVLVGIALLAIGIRYLLWPKK